MRDRKAKHARSLPTRLGLLSLALALASLLALLIVQRIATGSFARAQGFVAGPTLGTLLLVLAPLGVLLFLIGSTIDAARDDHRRRAHATPTKRRRTRTRR